MKVRSRLLFATIEREHIGGLIVSADPLLVQHYDHLIELAVRHRGPVVYAAREPVMAGGLMSYTTDWFDVYRQAGVYAGRILKGEKPGDLPVQRFPPRPSSSSI